MANVAIGLGSVWTGRRESESGTTAGPLEPRAPRGSRRATLAAHGERFLAGLGKISYVVVLNSGS